jgi:hypothetical protein
MNIAKYLPLLAVLALAGCEALATQDLAWRPSAQ